MRWLGVTLALWRRKRLEWFPERQLVLRERDRVRALTLSTNLQVGVVAVATVLAIWLTASSGAYVYHVAKVSRKNAEIERTRIAYHELIEEVSSQHDKVMEITRDLDHYRTYLQTLVAQNDALRQDMRQLSNQMAAVGVASATPPEGEAQRLRAAEEALLGQLREMEREIASVNERNDLLQVDVNGMRTRIASSDDERRRFAAARSAIDRRIGRLEHDLTAAQTRVIELERGLASKQQLVDQSQQARRLAHAEREDALQRLAQLEKTMKQQEEQHQLALTKLSQRTNLAIAQVEAIVGNTGLELNKLAPTVGPRSPSRGGGPFIPWREQLRDLPVESQEKAERLDNSVDRLERINLVLSALPIAAPIKSYTVLSNFGYRRDPFNGRAALHEGIDLDAPVGTPIRATAEGKVIFSGWHASYGRMVEIEHGFGIRTRYAHMNSLTVEQGATVKRDQQIGTLGNTGRSSGPHLHYEVLLRGNAVNPEKFLKAKDNVRKVNR